MGVRQCVNCGRLVADTLLQCPHCREPLPEIRVAIDYHFSAGGAQIRRGLLYMLMATVLYYFAGGHSPLAFPLPFGRELTDYLLPLLFLGGLGLATYGLYLRLTT